MVCVIVDLRYLIEKQNAKKLNLTVYSFSLVHPPFDKRFSQMKLKNTKHDNRFSFNKPYRVRLLFIHSSSDIYRN
jgi:hypothetical protein